MAVEIDQAVPLLDVADQAFSVRSAQVRRARQASRHARDELRAGGAAARPGGAADQAPEAAAAEQAVARPSRRHLRAIRRLVGELGAQQGGRGTPAAAPATEPRALPADHRPVAAGPRAGAHRPAGLRALPNRARHSASHLRSASPRRQPLSRPGCGRLEPGARGSALGQGLLGYLVQRRLGSHLVLGRRPDRLIGKQVGTATWGMSCPGAEMRNLPGAVQGRPRGQHIGQLRQHHREAADHHHRAQHLEPHRRR
jgi:hypothetical protein